MLIANQPIKILLKRTQQWIATWEQKLFQTSKHYPGTFEQLSYLNTSGHIGASYYILLVEHQDCQLQLQLPHVWQSRASETWVSTPAKSKSHPSKNSDHRAAVFVSPLHGGLHGSWCSRPKGDLYVRIYKYIYVYIYTCLHIDFTCEHVTHVLDS